jgi:N-acetylated-alpha-linked acidic dipeptidase
MSYGGEDDGGIYHSIYDDFCWFMNFSDSSFAYGKALAQTMGVAVMRLASADLLPFTFTNLAETARTYATELQRLRDSRNEQINDTNRMIDDGVYLALRDPRNPVGAPMRRTQPPQFNFAPLLNALDSLSSASRRYDRAAANLAGKNPAALKSVNAKLVQAERALTSNDGLKGRGWYKHLIYAPGFYTGYGVKTMPAVRESIEQGEWENVDGEISRVAAALTREATLVSSLARDLGAK